MNGDTRKWWIVRSGTLRFTIEGREPIVAAKGVMVQVPYRTLYQIENIGIEPALRFEVNVGRARKLYPVDETSVPLPGFEDVKTRVDGGRGLLDPQDRQLVDFNKVVSGEERGGLQQTPHQMPGKRPAGGGLLVHACHGTKLGGCANRYRRKFHVDHVHSCRVQAYWPS
jgi:hypothetical protein